MTVKTNAVDAPDVCQLTGPLVSKSRDNRCRLGRRQHNSCSSCDRLAIGICMSAFRTFMLNCAFPSWTTVKPRFLFSALVRLNHAETCLMWERCDKFAREIMLQALCFFPQVLVENKRKFQLQHQKQQEVCRPRQLSVDQISRLELHEGTDHWI